MKVNSAPRLLTEPTLTKAVLHSGRVPCSMLGQGLSDSRRLSNFTSYSATDASYHVPTLRKPPSMLRDSSGLRLDFVPLNAVCETDRGPPAPPPWNAAMFFA